MKNNSRNGQSARHPSEPAPAAERTLDETLAALLEQTVAKLLAADRRADPMFGPFGPLVALSHLAYGHEARLLEQAASLLCEAQPHLRVVHLDKPIPIVPAAREALQSNDWEHIEGIRLPSRVYSEDGYAPDLVIVDSRCHEAFLFDIKRSVDTRSSRVRALREKMKAAALVAPDWLAARARAHMIACTRIAILDASGETDDPKSGVLTPSGFERVLGVPGFAAVLGDLRERFSARLQAELDMLMREPGRADAGEDCENFSAPVAALEHTDGDHPDESGPAAEPQLPVRTAQSPRPRVGFAIPLAEPQDDALEALPRRSWH
ncbi:hypothetical protein [Oricola sp.]|uniref:hypothetical protein n=1 Tax=Oricola sp. TaxID=1979950 RepID=UPI003516A927